MNIFNEKQRICRHNCKANDFVYFMNKINDTMLASDIMIDTEVVKIALVLSML